MDVVYDSEQQRLIDCNDKVVVGEAFAGSGKTTTAIGYCRKRPNERILYLCLTKANQLDAKGRFPPNVTCMTSHSLAYKALGDGIAGRAVDAWKARHVAEELGINTRRAAAVRAVILAFLADDSTDVDVKHVMHVADKFDIASIEMRKELLSLSKLLWQRMCDMGGHAKMPHDAYLKLWALSKPQLDYDVVIVDEAQDTNAIVSYVVMNQQRARVVLIGDRHQSIYGFRGAKNAMEFFASAGATVIKLTNTWRFGPKTAMLANALLSTYKDEKARIVGKGHDEPYHDGAPVAFLARTNAQLFALAATRRGEDTYWIGGSKNYRLDLVQDAYHLYSGDTSRIHDPVIARYPNWASFVEEFGTTKDAEFKILIDAVSTYGDQIPDLIAEIRFNEVDDPAKAQRVLGTGHKSKGFEFPYVRICEDFRVYEMICQSISKTGRLSEAVRQEVNLLYVAMTRASKKVFLNTDTKMMFQDIAAGTAVRPIKYVR